LPGLRLARFKASAESLYGVVDSAVIALPVAFTWRQQQATVEAAEIAGLKRVRTVPEPVAATISYAYSIRKTLEDSAGYIRGVTLVVDVGGGTSDASAVYVNPERESAYVVLSTVGDKRLCGVDFDDALYNSIIAKFPRIKTFPSRKKCEGSKKELSTKARVAVQGKKVLSREEFKKACEPLLNRL